MSKLHKINQSERLVSKNIPMSHHVSDNVIATHQGVYLATIKYTGRGFISANPYEVERWIEDLNGLTKTIPADKVENIAFWGHVVRRKISSDDKKQFKNKFCRELNEKYKNKVTTQSMMINEIYLTICFKPVASKTLKAFGSLVRGSEKERIEFQESNLEDIHNITDLIVSGTLAYDPEILGVYERNDRMFCKQLEFFNYLVNHEMKPMPVGRESYNIVLANRRILFSADGEFGELRGIEKEYFGMLEVKEYDDITAGGHLNVLLGMNCEFILSQSFVTLSKYSAKGFLQKHRKFLIDSDDLAVSQINKLEEALDDLMSGRFAMGEHSMTLTTYGKSVKSVKKNLQLMSSKLSEVGLQAIFLDLASESAYYSQLPSNYEHRTRPAPITSLNFWSFFSMHNHMCGKKSLNPWGECITTLNSVSGSPYYFNFHKSPVQENSLGKVYNGNAFILGKSGSGKTTLLTFLLAQSQSVDNLRLVIFDKDQGMSVFVKAMGGVYSAIKLGEPSGFNPFQLADNNKNRAFLFSWLKKLLSLDNYSTSYQDEIELEKALNNIFKHQFEDRNFTTFVESLPNPIDMKADKDAKPSVYQRLEKWVTGEYAWVFNNPTDTLDFTKSGIFGFDATEFLDVPELRSVIIKYIFYRSEQLINKQPIAYVLDEGWRYLQDEEFKILIVDKLKTIRKQLGIIIFATQEANDLLQSGIASTLISQCVTQIYLENPTASEEDYVDKLKLTPTELEVVQGIPDKSYQFLIKQGSGEEEGGTESSSLVKLNLKDFSKEMHVLSGTPDNAELFDQITRHHPDKTVDERLEIFYQHKGH